MRGWFDFKRPRVEGLPRRIFKKKAAIPFRVVGQIKKRME
jgi:hypothetical protein